jgi:hypothetical protein
MGEDEGRKANFRIHDRFLLELRAVHRDGGSWADEHRSAGH